MNIYEQHEDYIASVHGESWLDQKEWGNRNFSKTSSMVAEYKEWLRGWGQPLPPWWNDSVARAVLDSMHRRGLVRIGEGP
mgnify:CR=1 FL=1